MEQNPLDKYRPLLGTTVEHDGRKWRVSTIRMEVLGHPWAWLVNVKKPNEQARLSLKAECFT